MYEKGGAGGGKRKQRGKGKREKRGELYKERPFFSKGLNFFFAKSAMCPFYSQPFLCIQLAPATYFHAHAGAKSQQEVSVADNNGATAFYLLVPAGTTEWPELANLPCTTR